MWIGWNCDLLKVQKQLWMTDGWPNRSPLPLCELKKTEHNVWRHLLSPYLEKVGRGILGMWGPFLRLSVHPKNLAHSTTLFLWRNSFKIPPSMPKQSVNFDLWPQCMKKLWLEQDRTDARTRAHTHTRTAIEANNSCSSWLDKKFNKVEIWILCPVRLPHKFNFDF